MWSSAHNIRLTLESGFLTVIMDTQRAENGVSMPDKQQIFPARIPPKLGSGQSVVHCIQRLQHADDQLIADEQRVSQQLLSHLC